MKKKLLSLSFILFTSTAAFTQPAIDSTSMPFPHDTVKRTVIASLTGVDYITAGSNQVWDFSTIDGNNYVADTFISVNSTPFAYIFTFSNPFDQEHKATVASRQPAFQSPPGVTISDLYAFYKNNYYYYGQVGFGANINGATIPIKFDHADIMYSFPLQSGNVDSCFSQYSISIPTFGYYGEKKHRTNYVDGWGTIYLPGDTFQVMRVRSEMRIFDSVYVDQYSMGFGFNRTETEYKWLAQGYTLPVLQVTKPQGGMGSNNATGSFIDHRSHAGISESSMPVTIKIYPNPATDQIIIENPKPGTHSKWSIIDINGRLIMAGSFVGAGGEIGIDQLNPGVYFVRLISEGSAVNRMFVRE